MKSIALLRLRRRVLLMLLQQLNQRIHVLGVALDVLDANLLDCLILGCACSCSQLLDKQIFIRDGVGDVFQFFTA